ncbi:MAG: hypothetical protein IJ055_10705 [Oscillospiraceae bacterium]|nr:hypothetical protein [Oscillospiraceae bacterium]
MKHRITVRVPVEKRTLFGRRTEYVTRTITVDDAAYHAYRTDRKRFERSLAGRLHDDDDGLRFEDMMLMDALDGDEWDDTGDDFWDE